jgi:hypothetical protein
MHSIHRLYIYTYICHTLTYTPTQPCRPCSLSLSRCDDRRPLPFCARLRRLRSFLLSVRPWAHACAPPAGLAPPPFSRSAQGTSASYVALSSCIHVCVRVSERETEQARVCARVYESEGDLGHAPARSCDLHGKFSFVRGSICMHTRLYVRAWV